jgi:UDP-N-acetylglucosamine 3-dehydrogenase
MDKLGVGVIGLGWWGDVHACIYSQLPHADLVAVCSRTEARAQEIAARYDAARWYTDYRDLIGDPEIQAVNVVTPEGEHYDRAMAAIDAGKHVLLEKPITEDVREAEQLFEAARRANVQVAPGFELRFEVRHALVKEKIDAGDLGDIVYVRARRNWLKHRIQTDLRSHPALVMCSHDIDLILWYVKDRVKRVRAHQRTVGGDHPYPNMVVAVLEFEGGAVAYVESIWMIPDAVDIPLSSSMEVVGTKGIANVDFARPGLDYWSDDGYSVPDVSLAPVVNGVMVGSMRDEMAYFVDRILRGQEMTVPSMADALQGLKVVTAVIESAERGEEVELG